ncbi:DUF952 domain-containing protein [Lysobacter sp. K5869]|uniref:DUF952 domain-containing protein n=1 Tax=Lysobacter sp. K5869 TaxID=2820808 RepID=UPI001C0622D0|nr:DUF952 domain-containing protein [Lysobacter sp. K5869]QWP75893.1 DUF952 domain-containing protein [Lysobacter sp. K5869]
MTTIALLASMLIGGADADERAAHPTIAYKILTRPETEALRTHGRFAGSPADLADGFIHLSTAEQLTGTADRHFPGQTDLFLAAVNVEATGETMKWERSPRSGLIFPHLYGVLEQRWVMSLAPLRRDSEGRVVVGISSASPDGPSPPA